MRSERYHLEIDDLNHVDSTSYALVEGRKAMAGYWPAWEAGGVDRHTIFSRHVSEFFTAFLLNSPESLAFLSHTTQQAMEESGLAMEYRSATPPDYLRAICRCPAHRRCCERH